MDKIEFKSGKNGGTPVSSNNLNQMQTNIENAINEISEVITNENGTAIKYSNGIMICKHKTTGKSFTCNANITGRYYFTDTNNSEENTYIWRFPEKFISADDLVANVSVRSNAYVMTGMGNMSTDYVAAYAVTPYAVSSCSFTWNFIAIGRWK